VTGFYTGDEMDLAHQDYHEAGGYPDGTGGHSGSDTSQARAERDRDSGRHSQRADETLLFLTLRGAAGATWFELAEFLEIHHGAASGILSNLHKAGTIARTPARRNRSKVYVLPQFVGEVAEPYGGRKAERDLAIRRIERALEIIGPNMQDSPGTLGVVYRTLTGEQS
jgi:hypothetical protein